MNHENPPQTDMPTDERMDSFDAGQYDASQAPADADRMPAYDQTPDAMADRPAPVNAAAAQDGPGRFAGLLNRGRELGSAAWNSEMGQHVRQVAMDVGAAALEGAVEGTHLVSRTEDGYRVNRAHVSATLARFAINPKAAGLHVLRGAAEGGRDAAKSAARREAPGAAARAWDIARSAAADRAAKAGRQ